MKHNLDYKTRSYRIIVFTGFSFLFVLMLWWMYCALRAQAPQMTDIDVSKNNRPSTVILIFLLIASASIVVSNKMRHRCKYLIKLMVKYKWILFGCMVIWQILIMLSMGPFNGADSGWIVQYVIDPNVVTLKGLNGAEYFSNSPNNYLIYFMELGIHKLIPFANTVARLTMVLRVLSIIIVDLSAIGAYRLALEYGGGITANVVLFFWCALLGLSGWCLQPYSDVFSLPLVLGLLALSLRVLYEQKLNIAYFKSVKNDVLLLLFGVLIGVTYAMKPSAVIPAIACIVLCVINQIRWRSLMPLLIVFAIIGFGFASTHVSYQKVVESQTIMPYDKDLTLPPQHFIMMGLANTGGYDDREYEFTMSKKTYKDKVEADSVVIKSRLKEMGAVGYLKWALIKFRNFASDGTFGMYRYSNFFHQEKYANPTLEKFQNTLIGHKIAYTYTPRSTENVTLAQMQQVIFITLVFGMLCCVLFEAKSYGTSLSMRKREMSANYRLPIFLGIVSLGSLIFLLIFEAGHSRYLIQFFPIYAFLAGLGLNRFRCFVKSICK